MSVNSQNLMDGHPATLYVVRRLTGIAGRYLRTLEKPGPDNLKRSAEVFRSQNLPDQLGSICVSYTRMIEGVDESGTELPVKASEKEAEALYKKIADIRALEICGKVAGFVESGKKNEVRSLYLPLYGRMPKMIQQCVSFHLGGMGDAYGSPQPVDPTSMYQEAEAALSPYGTEVGFVAARIDNVTVVSDVPMPVPPEASGLHGIDLILIHD